MAVAGCMPTEPPLEPAPVVAASAATTAVREIHFEAESNDTGVAASCVVSGADYSHSFVTPAVLELPLRADDRLDVVRLSCSAGEDTVTTDAIPGTGTTRVKVTFGKRVAFWFKNRRNNVLYYEKADGTFVLVSGSPEP